MKHNFEINDYQSKVPNRICGIQNNEEHKNMKQKKKSFILHKIYLKSDD